MSVEKQEAPGRLTDLRSRFSRGDRSPASVFVVGTLFSGSTLIGRDMTTRIKRAHYVGELNNYTQLPGFSHTTSGRQCGPCALLGRRCPHFTKELAGRVTHEDVAGIHEELARSLGASVVIDGSKYVVWLRNALEQRSADAAWRARVKVIVTVRNPIAFALSHRNRTGEALWLAAGIWRDTYVDALRTINGYGLPHVVVRYEDHMADPELSLLRLSAFLNLPLEAEPDNGTVHDTGGNWSSFVPYVGIDDLNKHIERLDDAKRAEAEIFVRHAREYWNDEKPREDTRWRGSLDAGEVNAVLNTPGLADMASLLGYNVAEVVHAAVRPS
ncbi:hypothetical protein [Actinomadura fibrosa]|uniref:Sulfotransferase n=1 Tax=Actinomadura fibrosa TaxID=111802 RepID=A0ABW2XG65_9ACTN|nr:hypothetical protein [Actinomadura fibrosa]